MSSRSLPPAFLLSGKNGDLSNFALRACGSESVSELSAEVRTAKDAFITAAVRADGADAKELNPSGL